MITPEIKTLAELVGLSLNNGPWLSGGAARAVQTGEPIEDFDLFFRDEEQADRVEALLLAAGAVGSSTEVKNPSVSDGDEVPIRSLYYRVPGVGLVNIARTHYFASAESVHASFDFSCCQLSTDGETVLGAYRSFVDATHRVLRIVRETTPRRIKKYLAKGYSLAEGQEEAAWSEALPGLVSARSGFSSRTCPQGDLPF